MLLVFSSCVAFDTSPHHIIEHNMPKCLFKVEFVCATITDTALNQSTHPSRINMAACWVEYTAFSLYKF